MRPIRGRSVRRIWLGAGVVAALVVVFIAAWTPTNRYRDLRRPSDAPSETPATVGPVVYYEILDATGSRLMERRLDGHSLARQVAVRTDAEYGRTWIVDPTGATAIAMVPGTDDQMLAAVSIATGNSEWSIHTPTAPMDQAVWSADGRQVALASIGSNTAPREAIVIDATNGDFVRVEIPADAVVQGFDPDGALILRQHLPSSRDVNVGWRFLRVDEAMATVERVAALPDVGPASDGSEDVDPAAGLAVDTTIGAGNQGTAVRLWTLQGGPARTLVTVPSVDRIAFDPGGTGVAISADQAIRFVAIDGRASELFHSPDPIGDFGWSARGDYLAVATDHRGPNLTIVERATGRAVALPNSDAVAQLLLVRILGGVPLPATPLPAVEPTASPTAGPSGADVAGFGGLLSGWVDRSGATQVGHVERLVPTADGGLRAAAEMPPLDLGPMTLPDDGGPDLRLLPRPGSSDVLIWVATADRASGWLWDGAGRLEALALPADWPLNAFDVAWRPDGQAIAAGASRSTRRGGSQEIFAIAAPGDRTTTVVPAIGAYDRLEGWWSSAELRVGHGICTEGCNGRFSWSARLRIRDHHLVELTPADRTHGPVDGVVVDGNRIVLSVINDDLADDIVIDWPAALGSIDALDAIGLAPDGRSLLVAQTNPAGTDLYRIADPIGRSVGGRLVDPQPALLAHFEDRNLQVNVSPDGGWATVIDRVDNVHLVRLSDGRSWPVDRDRTLTWAAAR